MLGVLRLEVGFKYLTADAGKLRHGTWQPLGAQLPAPQRALHLCPNLAEVPNSGTSQKPWRDSDSSLGVKTLLTNKFDSWLVDLCLPGFRGPVGPPPPETNIQAFALEV